MGADAAVERHDGTPPREDEITARMRAEGLSPHGWGNGPGDIVIGPARVPHGFANTGPGPARLVCIHAAPAMTTEWDG